MDVFALPFLLNEEYSFKKTADIEPESVRSMRIQVEAK
jgi:hypothetical protein